MLINDSGGLGRIEVRTLPLPGFVKEPSGTYTYSGKVLVNYKTDRDSKVKDFYNIAIVNDDGEGFKNIFSGVIEEHPKANGIRFMPFQDNTRILLGDYVLECIPDIDNCESVKLVPVVYPWGIKEDERTFKHWSEIIISPDNRHICWTMLTVGYGAVNMIGILDREEDRYIIKEPQIISETDHFEEIMETQGYVIPKPRRGGEVKQFVRGGTAISLVGAKNSALSDSVVQDLLSEEIIQITRTPGYDETTILSPDERLGIVMSTRGSYRTNCAIFGLMPRPYMGYATQGMIWPVYKYSVSGVRSFRKGNIGPVLIEIERSMNEPDYQGVQLNDPEEKWVYLSPMSWHPSGKKVMWPEMIRESESGNNGRQTRIRIAKLLDYEPRESVPYAKTPENIPYGVKDREKLWIQPNQNINVKIAGKYSGYIEYKRQGKEDTAQRMSSVESRYVNFSDDGKVFYNGFERTTYSLNGEYIYETDLEMIGPIKGEMKFRITFSEVGGEHVKLLFDTAEDGKPKSYGFAEYNGTRINVEDMLE